MGWDVRGQNVPKIIKIHKFAKINPLDVQGSKRHPKGTQKSPKRHPKGIQKASKRHQTTVQKTSKLVKINSHWDQNSKSPMQRTARNHAPYQSFPSETKSWNWHGGGLRSALDTIIIILLLLLLLNYYYYYYYYSCYCIILLSY